jgi:gamma-glutamyltranspeptidase / glutathione hydrolase
MIRIMRRARSVPAEVFMEPKRPMMNMRSICLFVSVFWVTVGGAHAAWAADAAVASWNTHVSAVHHKAAAAKRTTAILAAANPMAADAGMEILRKGGDAVDAAVAIQAMLGLVEPQSSGVGGGSFFMYYSASTGEVLSLDGRERAPAGAKPDMFLDEHGKPLPFFQAVRSGRSTGVPGTFAMLAEAHSKLGSLPWKQLFSPAIRAAREGFKVPERMGGFLSPDTPFPLSDEVRALFARPDGSPLRPGDQFKNPAYAHTLERLAQEGPSAIYKGQIAEEIVKRTHEDPLPGAMTLEDLASYKAEWGKPVCGPFHGYSVCVPPPPSSGVSLVELLGMLDHTDIAQRGPTDPKAWFELAEASRLMYADRDRYIGDPEFVSVPVQALLNPAYVRERSGLIGDRAGPPPQAGRLPGAPGKDATDESAGTSHFVVMDSKGNVVSMTTTVESVFGSQRTVEGFVLNNQLTDFSFRPTDDSGRPVANAVQGRKHPRSSMAPIIVLDRDGKFVGAVGSPGGSAILDYNAKALVGMLGWGLPVQAAIELPNIIANGNQFSGEVKKFSPEVRAGLKERGVDLVGGRAEGSGLHGIMRKPDGTYEGGADPRREGVVRVLPPAK